MSDAPKKPLVLQVALSAEAEAALSETLKSCQVLKLPPDLEMFLDPKLPEEPILILCGSETDVSAFELAQTFRMSFAGRSIFYLTSRPDQFRRPELVKNGFTEAFLLPLDLQFLTKRIEECIETDSGQPPKSFRTVKLIDIAPGEVLDFDAYVYLPTNKRHVRISEKGSVLSKEKYEKVKQANSKDIAVPTSQIKDFYAYSAKRLSAIQGSQVLSETEKREKLQNSVRDLIVSAFVDSTDSGFDGGKKLVNEFQSVIKQYVRLEAGKENVYEQLQNVIGSQSDSYNHFIAVSTLAALFSIGTGIGKPEEVALAGLLHDLGLNDLPPELQNKEEAKLTDAEFEQVKKHVDRTLQIVKLRKMILPERVLSMIAQHHERFSGKGYPKGLGGQRILPESMLLSFANLFDDLTTLVPGRPALSPAQAFAKIVEMEIGSTLDQRFDPAFLDKCKPLFSMG